MSETMVFDTCDRGKCIEIEIVNDSYVEINEKFTVRVNSLHDRIKTDPDRAVVTILNEDYEFTSHQYYNYTKRGNEVVISFTVACWVWRVQSAPYINGALYIMKSTKVLNPQRCISIAILKPGLEIENMRLR